MGRIWTSGFELDSTTANVEFVTASGTIATSPVRTGGYSGAFTSATSGTGKVFACQFSAANANGPLWGRYYLYITTLPNANTTISEMQAGAGSANLGIVLTTTGTLELFTTDGATQIGSASSALSTNQWYCIEMRMDNSPASGSMIGEARINGSVFATSSTLTTTNYPSGITEFIVGVNIEGETCTTLHINFDDMALNNSTGSFQNTYPGAGNVLRYSPNAAGDSNGFLTQVGGTAGTSNNYTRVNEVTPDNATSYNASVTAASDLFAVGPVGTTLPTGATINVVQVGGRVANLTGADTTASLQFQIEQTTGGTIQKSAAIIPDTTTWSTNSKALPHNYPLTLYQDPTSTNWTNATIGTMQIGYLIDFAHTDASAVSTIWAYVDYTPASGTLYTMSLNSTYSTSGVLTKQTNKSPTSTYSTSGALTQRAITRALSSTYSTLGTLTRAITYPLVGSTYKFSGALASIHQRYLTMTATYSTSGILIKQTNKSLTSTYKSTGSLITFLTRVFISTYQSSGSLSKQEMRSLSSTYQSSGILTKLTKKSLTATYSSSGVITTRSITRNLSGIYKSSGVLNKTLARLLVSTYKTAGVLTTIAIIQFQVLLTSTYKSSGNLIKQTSRILTSTYKSVGIWTRYIAPHFVAITTTLFSGNKTNTINSGENIENIQSGAKIEIVNSGTKNETINSGNNTTIVQSGNKVVKL